MSDATASSRFEVAALTAVSIRSVLVHAAMYGAGVIFLLPYVYMVSTSLSTKQAAIQPGMNWLPSPVTVDAYVRLLSESQVVAWTINTIIIATVTTFLVLLFDSMIAFSLTRLDWPGQRLILGVVIASFMVPGFVNIIPLYTFISNLGLLNNYLAVIFPFVAGPLGVFMLVQFFDNIPDEIQEAARLDGFSAFRIYTHIVLPLSRSILTALGLFIFVWSWNQFLWPLIVLQEEAKYTLPIGVVIIQDTFSFQPALTMAGALVASGPLFVLFLLVQDQLISAVEMQGVT
ncbi:carbohydrate ABC transporter permease [Haloarcula salina]|uniref:carbohydrate ABC transporter permease n=1 Tax=Haloarcula salina TaxID=1429914 RepID=UPI003C703EFC